MQSTKPYMCVVGGLLRRCATRGATVLAWGLATALGTLGAAHAAPYAYISTNDRTSVVNMATDAEVGTLPAYGQNLGMNPAGTRLYLCDSSANVVRVMDTVTNAVIATIPANLPAGVVFNPSGTRAYVTNFGSNSVAVIDTATHTVLTNILGLTQTNYLAMNPAGTRLYVANAAGTTVIDTATNMGIATIATGFVTGAMTLNASGTRLYVASNVAARKVVVIDTATNAILTNVSMPGRIYAIQVSADASKVYVSNYVNTFSVAVIDAATNTVAKTIDLNPVGIEPMALALNATGTKLYVTGRTSTESRLLTVDTATDTVTSTFRPYGTVAGSIAIGKLTSSAPLQPKMTGATPGNQSATLIFDPGFDGELPATYTATCAPGASSATSSVSGSSSPLTVTGLATASLVTCTVVATNANGSSAPTAPTAALYIQGPPAITSASSAYFTVMTGGTFNATSLASPNAAYTMTGTLPAGLTFVAWGVLSGTPAAGSVGTYPVTLSASNNIGPDAVQNFTIVVFRQWQTIVFGNLANKTMGDAPFALSATGGGSGNAVAFASQTAGVCTVAGSTVTLVAPGTCTISANQTGNANYDPAVTAVRSFTVAAPPATAARRFDTGGDGKSDVIWYHSGVFGVIGMNANGLALDPYYIIDIQSDANWVIVGLGDLNGDGKADLVWHNTVTGEVYCLLLNSGTVLSEGRIALEANLDWKPEQIADVNGDGKADIVWKNQATGDVYVMIMNGLVQAGGQVVYTEPNLNWKILASGDMNGDGKADLLWRNVATGDIFAMLMDGFTVLSGGVIYTEPNLNWKIIGLADYNADGKSDVLWQNVATGEVYQMQMNGTVVSAGAVVYTEPNTQWKIVALGDYNGDGKADILWQNLITGQVYMILMDGFANIGANYVYTEPDTQWRIVGP